MKKTLLFLVAFLTVATVQAQLTNFSVGDTAPNFTVTDVDGNVHSLYDKTSAGQYVLLDFFFTTCPPCQQTAPIFNEFHEKYGCNTGDVFAISIDNGDNTAQVKQFETTYGGSFSHAPAVSGTDGGGNAVNTTYGPSAYPTYALIGPDNKFINVDIWPVGSVANLESAFPANSITPKACTAVSVDPAVAELPISIFPNPANNSAKVDLYFNEAGSASLEVFSLLGTRVLAMDLGEVSMGEFQAELDLIELEAGTYFVKVIQDNQATATQKLSVMH